MRVTNLVMENFRGIDKLSLDFDTRITVLVGINGSGKSSIIACISILLWELAPQYPVDRAPSIRFRAADIMNGNQMSKVEMTMSADDEEQLMGLVAQLQGPKRTLEVHPYTHGPSPVDRIFHEQWTDPAANIPLVVYYPVNRAVFDVAVTIPENQDYTQARAYEGALEGAGVDFRTFFQWFRNREDIENEERINNSSYRDREIEAVRRAVESVAPGFSRPRVRRAPPRMVVIKKDEQTGRETELQIDQLSDGEKCWLAMVGDLARRLAIANPGLEDPLHGQGVVLIDEIELHLHPAWQRLAVPGLANTFPNCQFIVSTHSPQVLSQVRPEAIYLLEQTSEGIKAYRPTSSYGRDSNRILEEIMGVSERPDHIKRDLHKYFRLIDEGKMREAGKLRKKLEKEIGPDEPEFAKADVLIRRKEILGR